MLEQILNPYIETPIQKVSQKLDNAGISAGQLTLGLLGCAFLSILATALHGSSLAIFLICVFVALVLIKHNKGASAKNDTKNDIEALDPLLPSLLYAILPLFLVLSYGQSAFVSLILVISIIALHLAQQLHLKQDGLNSNKGDSKTLGFMSAVQCLSQFGDRIDKAIFYILVLMIPSSFTLLAIIFSCLCWASFTLAVANTLKLLPSKDMSSHDSSSTEQAESSNAF